jgi:hypothetical protein
LSGQCKTILELNLPEGVLTTSKGRGTLWVTGPNICLTPDRWYDFQIH